MGTKFNFIKKVFPNTYNILRIKKHERSFQRTKDPVEKVKKQYFDLFGIELDLENPTTFYDKINYLKLFYEDKSASQLVDKLAVKDYLKSLGLEKYTAKVIATFNNLKEFKVFLKEKANEHPVFVAKLNHLSGEVFFYDHGSWRNKTGQKVSGRYVFASFRHMPKLNFYHVGYEKVYDGIQPTIFIEEYLPSPEGKGLDEYKFFCRYGEVKLVNIVYGRQADKHVREAFTDINLKKYPVHQSEDMLDQEEIYKPDCYEEMVDFCKKTVSDHLWVRVDLMTDGKDFKLCEFTFYDCAGFNIFYPLDMNEKMGELIDIKEIVENK